MHEGTPPDDNGKVPEEGKIVRPARLVRRVLTAATTGAVGWTAIDTLKPPSASTWIISTIAVVAGLALIIAVILGSRDSRSPFERAMLFLCLLLRQSPAAYLPPRPPEQSRAPQPSQQKCPDDRQ